MDIERMVAAAVLMPLALVITWFALCEARTAWHETYGPNCDDDDF